MFPYIPQFTNWAVEPCDYGRPLGELVTVIFHRKTPQQVPAEPLEGIHYIIACSGVGVQYTIASAAVYTTSLHFQQWVYSTQLIVSAAVCTVQCKYTIFSAAVYSISFQVNQCTVNHCKCSSVQYTISGAAVYSIPLQLNPCTVHHCRWRG